MADDMPIRWELGPVREGLVSPPGPPPKRDVDVKAEDLDGWVLPVNVPAYTLAECNHLVRLRVYVVPAGETLPGTAAELVASAHPFVELDTSGHFDGFRAAMTLPEVPPESKHTALVVRGFEV